MTKFELTDLVSKACEKSGLGPYENASYREGLEVLIREINACKAATEKTFEKLEPLIIETLVNRFRVEDYVERHPEVLQQPVEKPIFLFGIPRTGTTISNHLLGTDKSRRSLLNWEVLDSVPPPTTETLYSDPRCINKRKQQEAMLAANPDVVIPHWEYADDPTECTFILAQDFKSMSWEARLPMPGYSKWLLECDMTSAYEYHKKLLQVLQSQAPGIWNLKMPSHSVFASTLLKVYPDARLIWTHRDPYKTFASSCSLNKFSQNATGANPDPIYIGQNALKRLGAHLNGAMAAKDELGDNVIYDLHYANMMKEPIPEMRKLYAWLGEEFTPEIEAGMQKWLDDHPKGKHGDHTYSLEEYGLSVEDLKPVFGQYVERFNVKVAS